MGKTKSVMVGMSGGVDSSVTALLLQNQGYDVVGVTFRLLPFEDDNKSSLAITDSRKVCDQLEIPHYVFDYREMFRKEVVDYFITEYSSGNTPNPCVNCNKKIKFHSFLHRARGMGYDYIATGHYARVAYHPNLNYFQLLEGTSKKKDQSYFLYNLSQKELPYVLMPLGELDKPEVRKIAINAGLSVGTKSDSQDICFISDGDYVRFLQQNHSGGDTPGNFVDIQGNIVGEHQGIRNYTIGQRKGLGTSFGKPMYVTGIDAFNNRIILGDEEDLFQSELVAKECNWVIPEIPTKPFEINARIRYGAKGTLATVIPEENGNVRVLLKEPQRAVTPGQSVVFYQNNEVIGGGIIVA